MNESIADREREVNTANQCASLRISLPEPFGAISPAIGTDQKHAPSGWFHQHYNSLLRL